MKVNCIEEDVVSKERLYIPHGSDESSLLTTSSSMQLTFISHMVQMKGGVE